MAEKEVKKKSKKIPNAFLIWGVIALVFITAYLFFAGNIRTEKKGLDDIFEFLKQQGYAVNQGFSGIYQPGNIIQVTEMKDGREVMLSPPVLVISKKSCFPDKEPLTQPFTLPDYGGTSTAGLKAGAKTVAALLPDLALDSQTVANYSLKLGAIQTVAFARLDLSRKLSDQCVNDLQDTLDDGDRLEWFKVINEAVIADSLSFEIQWKNNTSVEARKSIEEKVFQEINQITQSNNKEKPVAQISSELHVDTDKKMILKAKGIVILAYKFRPLDKQKNLKDGSPGNMPAEKAGSRENNDDRAKIAVRLIQKNAPCLVRFDHPFVKGDKFRFEIIPGQDGSLYIFHHKPGKSLEMLWPRPEQVLAGRHGHPVQRGKTVEIPPSPANFYFDEDLTEERFYVSIAYSQDQLSLQKEIENFAVRGTNNEIKRVGYDPGQDPEDPYLYFSELFKESNGEIVEFRLGP